MQSYLFIAGVLAIVVGLVHSVLGEILIFRHLRSHGLVPTMAAQPLTGRNIKILWASWHVLTLLGCAFGAVLLRLAFPVSDQALQTFIEHTIIFAFAASSLIVLIGAKGKHPGWMGLLAVSLLTYFK